MPIYEYQCDGCGEVFEVRQRISDPPPAAHACGSAALHRVLSATSFVLKGTGWYATDYGNRSSPPKEGGESSEGGKADAAKGDGTGAGKEKAAGGKTDGAKAPAAAPSAGGKADGAQAAPAKAATGAKGGGGPAAA